MCKNITNVRVIWVLSSSYRYTHSRSNLCHSNVSSTYYVSKKYLNNLTFNIPKIDFSNPAKLSGSGGIFAGAGFRKSVEIQYSPSKNQEQWFWEISSRPWTCARGLRDCYCVNEDDCCVCLCVCNRNGDSCTPSQRQSVTRRLLCRNDAFRSGLNLSRP